jgi:hypothetical protein
MFDKQSGMECEEQMKICKSEWEVNKMTEDKVKQVRWETGCVGPDQDHISDAGYWYSDIFSAASRTEWTNHSIVSSVFSCKKTSAF